MADPEADVRRFFEEVWNQGNVVAAGDFLAAEFTSHNTFDVAILGPDDYGRAVLDYRTAFPDLTVTLEDVFASGDRVAVRGTDRGTHQGEFMGRAATGRPMTATWIEIYGIGSCGLGRAFPCTRRPVGSHLMRDSGQPANSHKGQLSKPG